MAGILVAGLSGVLAGRLRRVQVVGASMEPTLLDGDRLVVIKLHPFTRLKPGTVVALTDPRGEISAATAGPLLVKRVRSVEVDGVVVRGDNEPHSTDSRRFGPVPRHRIEGLVVWRYGPKGREGRIQRAG